MAGYALPALTEEEQVLASCRTDATEGLELLYRRYAPALVAFCQHRLGNAGDAEDAAHEAILKAHRALPRFREGARLWPWLATIAANVCTDMQRTRDRLSPEQDGVDCFAPEVDEDVSQRLRVSIVEAALDELPERFRTPLFLREFMGWSYEEIAEFSNKSIGSVRTTLMRARRAMQTRIEDVARRRGQWPLPAAVAGGWRRFRGMLRSWRDSASRASADAANALWRAESLMGGLSSGLQAAAVAVAAAGTLMVTSSAGASMSADAELIAATSQTAQTSDSSRVGDRARSAITSSGATSSAPTAAPRRTEVALQANDVAPIAPEGTGVSTSISRSDSHSTAVALLTTPSPGGPFDQYYQGVVGVTSPMPCEGTAIGAAYCQATEPLSNGAK